MWAHKTNEIQLHVCWMINSWHCLPWAQSSALIISYLYHRHQLQMSGVPVNTPHVHDNGVFGFWKVCVMCKAEEINPSRKEFWPLPQALSTHPQLKQWPHSLCKESADCLKYLPLRLTERHFFFPSTCGTHRERGGGGETKWPWQETSSPLAKWEEASLGPLKLMV